MDVNVEHQVEALAPGQVQRAAVRAVVVAENVGMFEKFTPLDAGFEFVAGDEVVRFAVPLLASGLSSRVGDRESQAGDFFQEPIDQRRFSGARRRGDDENRC